MASESPPLRREKHNAERFSKTPKNSRVAAVETVLLDRKVFSYRRSGRRISHKSVKARKNILTVLVLEPNLSSHPHNRVLLLIQECCHDQELRINCSEKYPETKSFLIHKYHRFSHKPFLMCFCGQVDFHVVQQRPIP